ncbi:MerR family transcriptional regulator [Methylomagnum sp.]
MITDTNTEPTFAIGAVSRLTHIPVDTLRAWERRYGAITPRRTADNRRSYTRADIDRLILVRQLVAQGHAVGSVIHLPDESLRERLRVHAQAAELTPTDEKVSVLAYGEVLPFLLENWADELPTLDIVGGHTSYADFEQDALTLKPTVLLAEWPALWPEAAQRLRELAQRTGARRTVVVYGFGPSAEIERARRLGIVTVRGPAAARTIAAACQVAPDPASDVLALSIPDESAPPPRLFDGAMLANIANLPTRVRCECPHHLADLVLKLSAFESYSADCENRDERDAALHAHLHQATAQARALVEGALSYLIELEGIDPMAGPSKENP